MPTVLQAPFHLPPIFSGERFELISLGIAANVTAVTVTSETPDGSLTVRIPAMVVDGDVIHALAAKELIGDLERGTSWLHHNAAGKAVATNRANAHIMRLFVQYNLVTSQTSVVAVQEGDSDDGSNDSDRDGAPSSVTTERAHRGSRAPRQKQSARKIYGSQGRGGSSPPRQLRRRRQPPAAS
jgi:hypothetical protein